jgi:hypothetical protein
MRSKFNSAPWSRFRRVVGQILTLAVAVSLVVSFAVPPSPAPEAGQWQGEARISAPSRTEALPVLNERQERPATSAAREIHVTLPAGVLEDGPVVHGVVILPVRNDARLSSHFVYTQTTSSRL